MNVRLLLAAGALSLGLATGAVAQGMEPRMGGMEQGQMGQGQMGRGQMSDDMAREQRPMRSNRKMRRNTKSKKMMRSRGRMNSGATGGARGNAMQQTGGGM